MNIRKEIGKGFYGIVYEPSDEDILKHGPNIVVKVIESPFKDEHANQFGKSRIAHTIYPANFPNVIASECNEPTDRIDDETGNPIHRQSIFFERVETSTEFRIFTQHTTKNKNGIGYCRCETCRKYSESLKKTGTLKAFRDFSNRASASGIIIDKDLTDLYLDTNGIVRCFEPKAINPWRIYLGLSKRRILSADQSDLLSELKVDLQIDEPAWLNRALTQVYSHLRSYPYEQD